MSNWSKRLLHCTEAGKRQWQCTLLNFCYSIVTCIELIYWFILRWIRFARKPAQVYLIVVVCDVFVVVVIFIVVVVVGGGGGGGGVVGGDGGS